MFKWSASVERSGRGFEGDSVAESFELSDVVALPDLGVDGAGVVVSAQVVEASVGIGEQVPDDDEHGTADRDDRLLLARRRAIRRYLSPRNVSLRPAITTEDTWVDRL